MERPNVLLLTLDSLRADRLSCFGHQRQLTPNLDRLAARGIRFTQAITGGSWTQAAFPVLFTSSYASMYGGCLGRLAPERPSPIAGLAAAGYATAGFSTSPHLSRATGYDRGFDYFEDIVPGGADPRLRSVKGGQRLLRQPLVHRAAAGLGRSLRPARCYASAADVTDRVLRWLGRAKSPFFAWAHYMDVHWPYHLEEALASAGDIAQAWQDLALMHQRANFRRRDAFTLSQRERFIKLYEQAVRYLDSAVGRLLDGLAGLGLDDNTIVIAVADHGEEFLEHGRWGHWESNLFDEIVRVPLIIRLPGWRSGLRLDRQVRLLDLMPTVQELCDCPRAEGVEGLSLVPLWRGRESEYDVAEAITEMQRPPWHRVAVRTAAFKYIWDNQQPDQPALYDLASDPGEQHNLAQQQPGTARFFQARVERHLAAVAQKQPGDPPAPLKHDADVVRRLQALGYLD